MKSGGKVEIWSLERCVILNKAGLISKYYNINCICVNYFEPELMESGIIFYFFYFFYFFNYLFIIYYYY